MKSIFYSFKLFLFIFLEGVPSPLIRFGVDLQPKYIPSFNTALYLSGGLSSLLYLFARVIHDSYIMSIISNIAGRGDKQSQL